MTDRNKKPQIIITRSERMTTRQKRIFDMLKAWGCHRFEALCELLELHFTEKQLCEPDYCLMQIATMAANKRTDHTDPAPDPVSEVPRMSEETMIIDPGHMEEVSTSWESDEKQEPENVFDKYMNE